MVIAQHFVREVESLWAESELEFGALPVIFLKSGCE